MDRTQKEEVVATLNQVISNAGVIVVTHYQGMTVAQMNDLRVRMSDVGANFKVVKNRLIKLALEGTDAAGITDLFQGPAAIAYSDDPVAAPKIVAGYAKENEKLVILGGTMGSTVLDPNGVKTLAELPSLDELRGKLVGMIQTPATRIAGVLQAPAGQLARVMNAYATKSDAA